MYAKNLEHLLAKCSRQSDVSPIALADIATRFESLRSYGRLPRGRVNRTKHLSSSEIISAILGLATQAPKWAGHAAIILGDLRPVGGSEASFQGASNLKATMELFLADQAVRNKLVALHLSVSERFTNSNGFAVLIYDDGKKRGCTYFVSKMAVSLLQPGAQRDFNPDELHAPLSRSMVLSREFFDRIAKAVSLSVTSSEPPLGDGSEYDAEEAQQARYAALGVRKGSQFLNIGVDTQVDWPRQEMVVPFDKFHLVLMPKTKENMQSVHIDLHANRLSEEQALTVINRFLSILTWCDDQFAIARGGWSGNPIPVPVTKRDLAFAAADIWPFDRRIPATDEVRRALALYREGRNAEEMGSVSYAVLSFLKIIEIRHPGKEKYRKWIASNFDAATAATRQDILMESFLKSCNGKPVEKYIHKSCRVAVAHASIDSPSDVDDWTEISRLRAASYVLSLLARHMIVQELGISENIYSGA